MASIVLCKSRVTGKVYAYLNDTVWNRETKRRESRRKYLGVYEDGTIRLGNKFIHLLPRGNERRKDDSGVYASREHYQD